MSVGGGKDWRRWRNVGAIMGKRFKIEEELKGRFGRKGPQDVQNGKGSPSKPRGGNHRSEADQK